MSDLTKVFIAPEEIVNFLKKKYAVERGISKNLISTVDFAGG